MSFTMGRNSLFGHLYRGGKYWLFWLQIFIVFFSGSVAQDNCGWDRFVDMSQVSNFTLVSPNISGINHSSTEPCQITLSAPSRPRGSKYGPLPSLFLFTKSFNLSGPGSCREDSARVEISEKHRPPIKWCGRTYAEKIEFYKDVHLEYYPGTKGQGSGFEMVFQDWQWAPFCNGVQHLEVRDEPMLLYTLHSNVGNDGKPTSDCTWNLTAPDDKIVLRRAFQGSGIPCEGPWLEFGATCQPVDFPVMTTQQTSTIITAYNYPTLGTGGSSLSAEYVAASRDAIQCVDSTPVHFPLTTEELFLQLDSSTTRCSLQFTTDSPDKTVDLSFVPVLYDASFLNVTEFTLELLDGSDSFINSSDVNQQPFRRFQSSHSSVTLTYNKLEVEEGIPPRIFAWLRARARLPEQLPRNLRATSETSFLWVSAAHLRSPYSGLVTITNDPWCLSLQVLDQTRTNAYTPADFFSAYTDFEESQYDLTYDCFGRPKEKMVLTHSESSTTTLSFHRNMSSSGFWLVYNSFKTDEECKGLRTELTKEGFEYTLPSDVFQRHSSCEFTMASNLSLGERVRFRVLHSESDVTLRSVEYDEAGHSKIHPLLDNGDWRPYKWVYSRYPLALTLKRSAYTRNGASSFSFEVIDTPGCDGSEMTVEVGTDSLDFNSADYPQQYQGDVQCKWRLQAPKGKSIQVELVDLSLGPGGWTYPCESYISYREERISAKNRTMYSMAIQLCSNSEGQTFAIDADRVILTLHGLGASFRLRLQAVDRSGKGSRSGEDSGFKYYGTVGGVCAAVVAVMATAIGVYFVRQYRMRQQKQSQANAETIVPLGARSYINGSFSEPPSFALSVTSPASVTPQPGTRTGHL